MEFYEVSIPLLLKLLSFLFWANMYLYTVESVHEEKGPEWCSRIITLIHGFFAALIGYHQCDVLNNTMCIQHFTKKISPLRYGLMLWSWGYFAFDLLWCIVYWTNATLMLCHHICTLGAITIYMHQDYTGCTFACTLVLMEITNPLLQLRWFLKNEGYTDTNFFMFIEVLYLTMFLFLRGILGTCIVYYVVFKSDVFTAEHKIITLLLYIVSIAFMYDILGYTLYKYKKEIVSFRRNKEIEMEWIRMLHKAHIFGYLTRDIGYRDFAAFCQATCLTFNEWQPLEPEMQPLTISDPSYY